MPSCNIDKQVSELLTMATPLQTLFGEWPEESLQIVSGNHIIKAKSLMSLSKASPREEFADEVAELIKYKIYTNDEMKAILKRREIYMYNISQHTRDISAFEHFINYERGLLSETRRRRQEAGLMPLQTEFKCVARIHWIQEKLLRRNYFSVKQWIVYAQFCIIEGSTRVLSRLFGIALRLNQHSTGLISLAAFFELEQGNGIVAARSVLQHGLRVNPKSSALYETFFALEMTHYKNGVLHRVTLPDEDIDLLLQNNTKDKNQMKALQKKQQEVDALYEAPVVPLVIYKEALRDLGGTNMASKIYDMIKDQIKQSGSLNTNPSDKRKIH
ncbi:MAG: hypothetical protein EZS28_013135 [Streblomastix strix]|uniref:U3 small nucleolar RNA-associated protein 6 N-terminal domain-containing protein n=1 Tax=Streblomastix strix TaxID=222440 RepID=A0A5J4W8Z7_9EUKA|nr:MAG: hypothetical protein EZS28_013135 [Streblomastix strix]